MNNRWSLKNKKALVTGATKGIGKAIALEMLDFGAQVCIVARSSGEINTLTNQHNNLIGVQANLSEEEGLTKTINFAKEHFGYLDILVNNVGVNIRKKTAEYSKEEYEQILNTNLTSAFQLSQMAYPLLKGDNDGSIINISSVAGQKHLRTGSVYGFTKAAMIQLTKNLACEWAEDNIRVNAIAPWYIKTPLAETVLKDPDYYNEVVSRTPLKKVGDPEDVASLAVFLCMPASKFTTGQCISIDGGFTVYGF
jgi:Tropinone reductase 1